MDICLNASSTKRLPDGGLSRFQRWISSSSKSSGMLKFLMSVARFKTCAASKSSSVVFFMGLLFGRKLRNLHRSLTGNPANAVKGSDQHFTAHKATKNIAHQVPGAA